MIYLSDDWIPVNPSISMLVKSPKAPLGEKLDSPKEHLCTGTGATLICLWHAPTEWQVQEAAAENKCALVVDRCD